MIDAKTIFTNVSEYATRTVFNLTNDATMSQLEFVGPGVSKNIFACTSYKDPVTVKNAGLAVGLNVFVLGRYSADPVARARDRGLLLAAVGCNLAWGVIDGVLIVMSSRYARRPRARLIRAVRGATDDAAAIGVIRDELEPGLRAVTQPPRIATTSTRASAR